MQSHGTGATLQDGYMHRSKLRHVFRDTKYYTRYTCTRDFVLTPNVIPAKAARCFNTVCHCTPSNPRFADKEHACEVRHTIACVTTRHRRHTYRWDQTRHPSPRQQRPPRRRRRRARQRARAHHATQTLSSQKRCWWMAGLFSTRTMCTVEQM